ncbi:MAG: gliding motility-associated C-terminal domain-containing protein, partial [Bacteroidota bacterium]
QTGTAGGTYTAAPAGLTINAATGQVTPGTSTAGTYTVTYTIPASGGCAVFTTTASVTITAAPSATISYAGSPFCTSSGPVSVTQTGTAGGTYTAAPAGLTINAATGQITPGTSTAGTYTVTYTIAASGGCAAFTTTASVTITQAPSATISYSSPYCSGLATPQSPTITGTAGGTFTSAPAGLTINAATGDVTPSTSTAGTYTVTYSIPASGGCAAFSTTASVTITNNPSATISYSGSPYCSNLGSQAVTLTGSGGGTFTSAPAGLSLNAATGAVNPSASSAGTYTVTYSIPASGGCAAFSTTASVTITTAPSATISYAGSPFCTTAGPANVTQTGTAGGTYTAAPAGLTINAATGQITPGTSTAGTYTVTYTIAASGGCPVFTTTASVTITAAPSATISYPGSPFCSTSGPVNVTQTGTAGGTYTAAPAGLTINAATGQITPGTSTAGTYTVTYSIAASGGCAAFSTTASVTITAPPTIANSGPPQTICETTGSVTMAGNTPTVGTGSWSQISGPVVGTITTPGSPTTTITGLTSPGAYVFQWAISNPPCTPSTSNVTITVNPAPTASSAGPAQTICSSVGTVTMAANAPTVGTGLWTQTGGPAATITTPTSPTTTITGLTAAGTYTFSWTISNAPCAPSSSSVTITVNANPAFAIGATVNPSGCGLNDGSITLTGLSPSTNYTITYDDGSIVNLGSVTTTAGGTYTITGLGAGTYSNFVVTSTAGCATTVNGPVNLVDPSAPTGTVSASTNPTTCGGTDGTITISGLTPSSTYDISYSDGSSTITLTGVTSTAGGTYTITGLAAGTYSGFSLTLAGCTGAATGSATLSDPASPTFTSGATFTNPTSCGAADGTITLSGLLPSTSYNLSYDGPSGTVVVGNITTDASGNYVITGLVQGSYTNFVITATNNCSTTSTTNVTLTDPSAPVFTAGSSFTDPTTCNGTDGTITISGLNPSTTYDISYNGPSGVVTLTGVTTDASGNYVITGLGAGTYNNFIVSLAGCNGNSGATTVTLTDPTPPTFSAGTTSTNPTTCGGSDGTITISGLAPSTNYNIAYDGPSGTVNLGTVTTDASGNYVITGLPSGTYFNFSVTQSGCTTVDAVTSVNLTDPGAPTFTISGTGTNPTTCGGTDGSFDITGLMPNTTYDFIYDDGSGPVTVTGTTDASGNYTVTGLAAGTYTNISVSLLGCTSVNSTTITLTDPGLPAFTVTGTNPTTCGATDGTITFSGLTPSTSYNYSYFDGTTTVTATVTSDASGNIIITGLAPGTYDQFSLVTSGCTGTSATVITLTDPGAPAAPVAGTNASYCQGDVMADLTATAGSGGTLTWYSDAGLTTVIGTGTTLTPSATLGSTTYYVTETTGSCESAASTVTITINTIPSAPVAGTDASYCSTDAFAAMTATPGSGGTINWYTDPGLTVLVGSGNNFTPLNVIGTTVYYVTEDVSGCESTTPATVTIIITDCDTLQVEIPTGFTPDGDGINDTWNILNLNSKFPNNHVEVFNRWGAKLFESDGYATPWDGTYKGNLMPVASYYFVIDFGDGSEPRKGTVTIIR